MENSQSLDHIAFYESKASLQLKRGQYIEASQSYASAAKICQSLEDLENASTLYTKSSEAFQKTVKDNSSDSDSDSDSSSSSNSDNSRDCSGVKDMVVKRLKSCFD